jgi:uncharacterized SAM-binding protein YcdF (DUF218 family)
MIILRLLRVVILAAGFLAMLWLAGLVLFTEHVRGLNADLLDPDPSPVDAIVVLTGGSERVPAGLELLSAGKGKKLFISGVYPGLTPDKILGSQNISASLRSCCIVLGHVAESTQGNAEETEDWLAIENYHSLRLVTANYHMPRSLLLFHTLMPDMVIVPHPIAPESVVLDEWWQHAGTASLLINEYDKYLVARFGIWMTSL